LAAILLTINLPLKFREKKEEEYEEPKIIIRNPEVFSASPPEPAAVENKSEEEKSLSEKEMSARAEEYHHAKQEGVVMRWLSNPVKIHGDEKGWVKGVECQPMKLGEPDASGRARPIPSGEPTFIIPAETVVVAVGTSPNRLLTREGDFKITYWGGLIVNEETGETSNPGVFAGGDAVTGAATVILAAGAGLKAAKAIHEQLSQKDKKPKENGTGKNPHKGKEEKIVSKKNS